MRINVLEEEDMENKEEVINDDEEKQDKKKKDKHSDKKIKELESIISEKDEKIKNLQEDVLREKAEVLNFKKRKDEETAKILKYSNEDIVKEILPIMDNFERAINAFDECKDESILKYSEGVKMIYCHLNSVLEKFEVIPIDGSNKPFDPVYHQGLMLEHKDGVEPGMVLEVLQKGYLLKDRVIRPAMVKVSE